ncbi:hypothetical protein CRE_22953 [Caenorhabditis remanei]|uniref:Lin-15A/B-like domain-containing protein n=1 Tax=Caenorhabditis remanei TaxID=31234 RepID=E3MW03_CAERE|nr:hypothetical protein CRE_22953 [Caenorhabditis remanei]
MSDELAGNSEGCSTSHKLENEKEESRESSNQREQDETDGSMDDGEEFQKQAEILLANFLKEAGLDDSVLEMASFKAWVHHLNSAVRLPNPSAKKPKLDVTNTEKVSEEQPNSVSPGAHNEIIMEDTDNESKIIADSTDGMVPDESEKVIDRTIQKEPPAPGLTPCIICGNNVTTHQSVNMTANEAIKALMAAVYCEKIRLEAAEAAVRTTRLKMCTTHHDHLYKWMCEAIGVKTVNDVDSIPGQDLAGVLSVYRRLKGIRDAFEKRIPSNTPVGAFKMAIKSYYRNYVPRKQGIVRSIKAIERIVKEDPFNQSFRKDLHNNNVPEASSFASNDPDFEQQQQERRTSRREDWANDEIMRPMAAVYKEGDAKRRKRILHLCQQMNPNLFPVRVVQPQPILPRPDFSPRMAKTVPVGYDQQTPIPNYVKVEGKVYKTVMAVRRPILKRSFSSTQSLPATSKSCDEQKPAYQEMVENEPDFYPPGEFPFSTAPIKTEEPEDNVITPSVNYENREVKQEIEEIEELPSNCVKSELDLEPMNDECVELRHVTKYFTNSGVIFDEKTTVGSILGV